MAQVKITDYDTLRSMGFSKRQILRMQQTGDYPGAFRLGSSIGDFVESLLNRWTGAGLTGAEREANEFSAEQAQAQMDFQREMADTQYQRGVADMQAAGINPALAYSQGGAVAPSGSAASSVKPDSGLSMSDLVQLMTIKPQMEYLKAQTQNVEEDTRNKESERKRRDVETEWLPAVFASEIGLREKTIEKYASEIQSILVSTEGQRLANEWNPKLWQNTLDNGAIDRKATIVGIAKIQQEISNLIAQKQLTIEQTEVQKLMQGLTAAQTALAAAQTENVSVSAWQTGFENQFLADFGYKPGSNIFQAVTGILGRTSQALAHPGEFIRNLFK